MTVTVALSGDASVFRDAMLGLVRQSGADLSARELSLLLTCCLKKELHTVRGLAESLNVAKPVITRALDRLLRLDLVARVPDPRDRRSVLIRPTAHGSRYVGHLESLLQLAARPRGVAVTAPDHREASGGAA